MPLKLTPFYSTIFATMSICCCSFGVTIVEWSFETSALPTPAAPGANTVYPTATSTPNTIPADAGANASGSAASAFHLGAPTYSTPSGNGSAKSLSATAWGIGDYWQFSLSTVGFSQVFVGYEQTGSNTGPRDFKLQYSSTGIAGPFTDAATYSITNDNWSSAVPRPASFHGFDLSAVLELAQNSNVAFRIIDTSATAITGGVVGAGGTSRIDNFIVADTMLAAPVPEPSLGMLILAGIGMLSLKTRTRIPNAGNRH